MACLRESLALASALLIGATAAAPARAEGEVRFHAIRDEQPLLTPVPKLRLHWPLTPPLFSLRPLGLRGYPGGALPLYRAESLWLARGPLQLVSTGSVELAPELDCRSTCQPVLEHSTRLELRLQLPSPTPAIPEAHAFLRSGSSYTSVNPRSFRGLSAGVAGAF